MRWLYISLIAVTVPFVQIHSQVKGLSASKLVSLTTQPVPFHKIEFEPSFSFFSAHHRWTDSHERELLYSSKDSVEIAKELGFRFTYGVGKNTEVGSYITSNTGTIAFSLKHKFFDNSKVSFAALAGTTIFSQDGLYSRQLCNDENGISYIGGLIGNVILNEKWSADFDIQRQVFVKREFRSSCSNSFANFDLSYRPVPSIQLINSFNYYHGNDRAEKVQSDRFTITPGAAFESSDHFIVVVGVPMDVWGRNAEIFKGVSFALTILFD